MSTTTSPRLTDEQQAEFLELAKDSDSVELKLTVPEAQHASTTAALGMDPLEAQIRGRSFRATSRRSCGTRRAFGSRSTRCPAASSSQARSSGR